MLPQQIKHCSRPCPQNSAQAAELSAPGKSTLSPAAGDTSAGGDGGTDVEAGWMGKLAKPGKSGSWLACLGVHSAGGQRTTRGPLMLIGFLLYRTLIKRVRSWSSFLMHVCMCVKQR